MSRTSETLALLNAVAPEPVRAGAQVDVEIGLGQCVAERSYALAVEAPVGEVADLSQLAAALEHVQDGGSRDLARLVDVEALEVLYQTVALRWHFRTSQGQPIRFGLRRFTQKLLQLLVRQVEAAVYV